MTTQLPLKPDYQAARAQLEGAISKKLAMVEDKTLASLPRYVADDMRGGYVRDVAVLLSPFTPDYYAECVEGFDGDAADHAFLDFCIQELNEYHAYLALVAWPNAVGRDYAWPALSFPLEQRWADKVGILEEARYPVVAGFGGDVRRASQLYRELTHDYAGFMTVEDIIKAGKDGHDD